MNKGKVLLALVIALSAGGASCTDPVRDRQIEALGGEDPNVPPGPDHRPGQPCVLCHSDGGPAEKIPFAVAGTIYDTPAVGSKGADGVFVQLVDANGGNPRFAGQSTASGNFFILQKDWPDMAFPLRVALYKNPDQAPTQIMNSLIGRDGSCNYCHETNLDPPFSDLEADRLRYKIPQIYLNAGGGT
jgi:hypothetical protein